MNKAALIAILSTALVLGVYGFGRSNGASSVQEKWTLERTATALVVSELKGKNNALADRYNKDTKELKDELSEQTVLYRKALDSNKRTLDERLLTATNRANSYKRQAEGGEAERLRLVEYTIRLDRQLEEGIFVVNNLSELVRQRDRELINAHQRLNLRNNLMEYNE